MAKPVSVLSKILELLINEYGSEQVLRELARLQSSKSSEPHESKEKSRKPGKRKTASDIVNALAIKDSNRRSLITRMAEQFDQKTFLPTIGVVKSFLDSRGYNDKFPKNRQDAAKTIIDVLNTATTADLEFLLDNKQFSGPSKLQSLSNAISRTGAVLRNRDEELIEPISNESQLKSSSSQTLKS